MAKLFWKLFRRSKPKYKKIDKAKEPKIVSTRTTRPAHFLFKIESFTKLSDVLGKSDVENYESPEFQCGGHKWKLSLYPNGNTKLGGDGHISLYLVTSETAFHSTGSDDVWAMFTLFIYDQKRDRYLTIQDGEVRRFHSMKKEWGFTRMLALKNFKHAKNGYLVDDCCIFGVEILVIPPVVKTASLSIIENPRGGSFTWKFNNFSSLNGKVRLSDPFTVLGYQWKLAVRLVSAGQNGHAVLLYLFPHEFHEANIYVECDLRCKSEVRSSCISHRDHGWFCERDSSSIWAQLPLSYLQDESVGYIIDDTLTVEVNINVISKIVTT